MKRLLAVVWLSSALVASGGAHGAPLGVAEAFRPASLAWLQLSPDGRSLLAFGRGDGADGAVVMDAKTLAATPLRNFRGGAARTARWLSNDRIAVAKSQDTLVFDATGRLVRSIEGYFVRALPNDEEGHERVLVAVARADGGLDRVDVRTGKATAIVLSWPKGKLFRWLPDRDGQPRVATTLSGDDKTATHWYRSPASGDWRALASYAVADEPWRPIAVGRDGRTLVVLSSQGRDTEAVFRYSLDDGQLQDMMAGHPSEDIGWIDGDADADDGVPATADAAGGFVRVVTLGMRMRAHWFDSRWSRLQAAVDAALPERQNWLSGDLASGTVLIRSSGPVDPGTWYLLDVASMAMREVAAARPDLDLGRMRPMRIVRYRSLDGLEIPAYLTLPAGPERDLPAVVLVHGGPIHRDRWRWDPEVQMLASRGYAVLQPQFRGSSGFGKTFERAGYRQWGLAMQDDVTAGAQWLAAQGIADPQRMCVYGASYGGYAAMWALVKTPRLFRCGASFAGVSDLSLMFNDDSDSLANEVTRSLMLQYVGDPVADAARFESVSPLKHADRVEVPVFLAHGGFDERVPIVHSNRLLAALKSNGKQVEWLRLQAAAHGFARIEDRETFYDALFAFLAKHTAPQPSTTTAQAPARP